MFRLIFTLMAITMAIGVFGTVKNALPDLPGVSVKGTDTNCFVVNLDNHRYHHILDHVWDAEDKGKARILHVDRPDATKHRAQSLKGIPTKRGYDRDEYPPAMSAEGGKGADVRYVRSAENRGAGTVMGHEVAHLANGDCFRFEDRPGG
jgi:hypothetical protein